MCVLVCTVERVAYVCIESSRESSISSRRERVCVCISSSRSESRREYIYVCSSISIISSSMCVVNMFV